MAKILKSSKKINIRETQEKNLEFVIKLEGDVENKDNVFQYTKDQHKDIIEGNDTLHLIITNENNKKIGYAITAGLNSKNKSIELKRIVISDKNNGYGSEFLRLFKEYVFEELHFHKLWLDFFLSNKKVEAFYTRNGFIKEGVIRDRYFYKDKYITIVVMSILEEDYYNTDYNRKGN